jgi:hypothetical protein
LLTEIRDNAIHFYNKDFELKKKVHEIGTANLKNYLHYIKLWFASDLSQYQIFLMPIAFIQNVTSAKGFCLNGEEKKLLNYVRSLENNVDDSVSNKVNLTLDVNIKFKRVSEKGDISVFNSKDINAAQIIMSEEDVREKYPWSYDNLTARLKLRYTDFISNAKFYKIKRALEDNDKYCNIRYLDPINKKGMKKTFYSPNIVNEYDKYYTKKKN